MMPLAFPLDGLYATDCFFGRNDESKKTATAMPWLF